MSTESAIVLNISGVNIRKFFEKQMCGVLILGLRPITILLIQSRNLFTLAPPLPPKMMLVWRSNAGSLLPTGAIMVSMGN